MSLFLSTTHRIAHGDDELGDALLLGILVVLVFAINEHHDVRILLDRSGFAKVREHRAVIGARFDRSRELGEGNDRNIELAGEALESARDLRDLLHAVFGATTLMSCR